METNAETPIANPETNTEIKSLSVHVAGRAVPTIYVTDGEHYVVSKSKSLTFGDLLGIMGKLKNYRNASAHTTVASKLRCAVPLKEYPLFDNYVSVAGLSFPKTRTIYEAFFPKSNFKWIPLNGSLMCVEGPLVTPKNLSEVGRFNENWVRAWLNVAEVLPSRFDRVFIHTLRCNYVGTMTVQDDCLLVWSSDLRHVMALNMFTRSIKHMCANEVTVDPDSRKVSLSTLDGCIAYNLPEINEVVEYGLEEKPNVVRLRVNRSNLWVTFDLYADKSTLRLSTVRLAMRASSLKELVTWLLRTQAADVMWGMLPEEVQPSLTELLRINGANVTELVKHKAFIEVMGNAKRQGSTLVMDGRNVIVVRTVSPIV